MQRHLFSPINIISILLYSKKHYDDFQARKNGAESPSPSPRKKARVDTPGSMTKDWTNSRFLQKQPSDYRGLASL